MTPTKEQKITALHKMKSDYGAVMSCIVEDRKDNFTWSLYTPRKFKFDSEGDYVKIKGYELYLHNKNEFLQSQHYKCETWAKVTEQHIQWLKDEIIKIEKELYYI